MIYFDHQRCLEKLIAKACLKTQETLLLSLYFNKVNHIYK